MTAEHHCSLAVPVLASCTLLADGRYRRRRKVRSSSTSSGSSSSISPPPASAAAAAGSTAAASRAKYACDECDRRYATSSNLSRHKQAHSSRSRLLLAYTVFKPLSSQANTHTSRSRLLLACCLQACPVTSRRTAASTANTPDRAPTATRSTSRCPPCLCTF